MKKKTKKATKDTRAPTRPVDPDAVMKRVLHTGGLEGKSNAEKKEPNPRSR